MKSRSLCILLVVLICSSIAHAVNYIDIPQGYERNEFNFDKCDSTFISNNECKIRPKATSIKVIVHRYQVISKDKRKLTRRYSINSYSCQSGNSIRSPGFDKPFTNHLNVDESINISPENRFEEQEIPVKLDDNDQNFYLMVFSKLQVAHQDLREPFFNQKTDLLELAEESTNRAKQLFEENNRDDATASLELAEKILDFVLNITPGFSFGRDVYEAVFGNDLISHEELDAIGRSFAVFGVLTGGFGSKIGKIAKALNHMMKGKNASEILRVGQNIFEVSKGIKPQKGNQFVRSLPDLEGSLKDAFDGHIFKGTYEPGEILYQAQRSGQTTLGNWFGPIKPLNADHADDLFNIRKWGNDAGQIKVYVVKERVSGYAGKVAGGEGHQFYIPRDLSLFDIVEEIK